MIAHKKNKLIWCFCIFDHNKTSCMRPKLLVFWFIWYLYFIGILNITDYVYDCLEAIEMKAQSF